ncbi:VOC family protein [Cryobacterium sp. PH31-L1]|uniref:VOC family protein n=1 Tax=Cryobacterium sp. PH31-L1 TaxID=3046199 RepID=UPI0024B8D2B8|nr:VOC family protein [Cryobacterium sp. PH31-L1]MDJ0378219.1 VOC family protein [Cryobacterium sp. PH31-L1]
MSSRLNPYLGFRDNAREAMDFYQSVFGGEVTRSTFGEFNASEDPAEKDKIMHSELTTTSGFSLMASDTPSSMELPTSSSVTVSLSGDDEAELTGYWEKLLDGGTATMPLSRAPWGDSFGMLVDKFGTNWMVNIAGADSASAAAS